MFQELVAHPGGWTVILATDTARMARDAPEAGYLECVARECGCRIEYSKLPKTGNRMVDRAVRSMNQAFDEQHAIISAEKGEQGMLETVAQGCRVGGRAPLGLIIRHM